MWRHGFYLNFLRFGTYRYHYRFRFQALEEPARHLSFKILLTLLLKSQHYAEMLPVCKCGKISGSKCLYSSINLRALEVLNLIIQITRSLVCVS
jgi:hypothetical protein